MTLADYLTKKSITPAEFARQIGRNRSTVTRLVRGDIKPTWDTMERIAKATSGLVRARDFERQAA